MSISTRTASLLLAAAAATVGIGIAIAAPATASPAVNPPEPVLPGNPLESHARALGNLIVTLPTRLLPALLIPGALRFRLATYPFHPCQDVVWLRQMTVAESASSMSVLVDQCPRQESNLRPTA
jgi:hypothetical protein